MQLFDEMLSDTTSLDFLKLKQANLNNSFLQSTPSSLIGIANAGKSNIKYITGSETKTGETSA